ncbi:MAG: hypothetical protein WB662_15980 [Methyloceanibacter sp.]|jgi:hypothetical protein
MAKGIPDEVEVAIIEATAAITDSIIAHTPADFHNQLTEQIEGIIAQNSTEPAQILPVVSAASASASPRLGLPATAHRSGEGTGMRRKRMLRMNGSRGTISAI